jgi:hypothetical protein
VVSISIQGVFSACAVWAIAVPPAVNANTAVAEASIIVKRMTEISLCFGQSFAGGYAIPAPRTTLRKLDQDQICEAVRH